MSSCFESSVVSEKTRSPEYLRKLQSLSLEDKILYSKVKIQEYYVYYKGKVYVSFSGGRDSTVLMDLVRNMYPEVPAVFFDTGLEFPEIREHVKTFDDVEWIKPKTSFRKVIETRGYPCIGKECAHYISLAQRGFPSGLKQMQLETRYGFKKYSYLVDAPFAISGDCCDMMKKRPAHEYLKKTGRFPIIGTRAEESELRVSKWLVKGDNNYSDNSTSNPLSIWLEKDIKEYIRLNKLPISRVYDMGYDRTGCVFCMFGIMQNPDRFLILKKTHLQLWEYCMKPWDEGGLGMREVLDFMKIPTGYEQTNLLEFSAIKNTVGGADSQ